VKDHEFLLLMLAVIVTVPISVEVAIRVRWRHIQAMFDRALMHGGSLDTLTRRMQERVDEAKAIALASAEATGMLKTRMDSHEGRLRELEEHPVIRRMGGNGPRSEP
jgi:hypothetical protein